MSRFKEKKSKTGKVIVLIIIMLILIAGIIGASYVIKKNYIVKTINQTNLIINNLEHILYRLPLIHISEPTRP